MARLQLAAGDWVGWCEWPEAERGFGTAPVLLADVRREAKDILVVEALQPLWPGGGRARTISLRIVDHDEIRLVGIVEPGGSTVTLANASFDWLEGHRADLLYRRPPRSTSLTLNGMKPWAPSASDYLRRVFGTTREEILCGASRASFGSDLADMPQATSTFRLDNNFGPLEALLIARGFVPEQMEDKWFIYREGDRLRFHRSWTGLMIYDVSLHRHGDCLRLGEVTINRDPRQYSEMDDTWDRQLLLWLVHVLLCGMRFPFPLRFVGEAAALHAWAAAGHAAIN